MGGRRFTVLLLGAWLFATGCGHGSGLRPEADPAWMFIAAVPFVHQRAEMDCGAAALAMVLAHGGRPTPLEAIVAATSADKDKGILAANLRAFARQRGFQAFLISGTLDDLRTELGRGHPVLVGLVKTVKRRRFSHYELVIGLRRDGKRIVTLDPASGRREQPVTTFLEEWAGSSRTALVVWREAEIALRRKPGVLP